MESFSLWCDFIHKDFLESQFASLLESGFVNGATSNPSIFANALQSPAYKEHISALKAQNLPPKAIYEALALADIKRASAILSPLFQRNHSNGFISIEIDPRLCNDIESSIAESKRLYKTLNAPNIMIKVPATEAGYAVMSALAVEGISVNATLIFSPTQAQECAKALQEGYAQYAKSSRALDSTPQGVISVFVSRFDRAIQSHLNNANEHIKNAINGKLGIMNALMCYEMIESFNAPHIRTLFASTGVKAPSVAMSASYYIHQLILPHSINTAPLEAIKAYKSDLKGDFSAINWIKKPSQAELNAFFALLPQANIDINALYQQLLDEGLSSFVKSFEELLAIL